MGADHASPPNRLHAAPLVSRWVHLLVRPEPHPQQVIDRWHPTSVRITTADSSEFVLDKPWIPVRDSLVGFRNRVPSSVAVSDITAVAIRQADTGSTIVLIAGLVAVLGLAASSVNYGPN